MGETMQHEEMELQELPEPPVGREQLKDFVEGDLRRGIPGRASGVADRPSKRIHRANGLMIRGDDGNRG
jgi:hypothetical protein